MKAFAIIYALCLTAFGGMPQLKTLRVAWDPYELFPGTSNTVIVLYKQVSLGTVFSPWKPTAYFPATRTNGSIAVLPGTYHFRATAQGQWLAESDPSNVVTNTVAP